MKPFKPPTLAGRQQKPAGRSLSSDEPPAKKRRISDDERDEADDNAIVAAANLLRKSKSSGDFQSPVHVQRKPLDVVKNPPTSSQQQQASPDNGPEGYFTVLW